LLTGCAAQPFQSLGDRQSQSGYVDVELQPGVFVITYNGTTRHNKELIEQYWLQRAQELCPLGYEVIEKEAGIIHGSIQSPINGLMVTLGTQAPKMTGQVHCQLHSHQLHSHPR
jgi:hypothetical protein